MNIANTIAISNMTTPIILTEPLTDSFTVNINPRRNKIAGKIE